MKSSVNSLCGVARKAMLCVAAIILATCGSSAVASSHNEPNGAVASIGANQNTIAVNEILNAGPEVAFTAIPGSVPSGGGATINWSAPTASSCTASGGWGGAKPTSGTHNTGALSQATTYTLSCTGTGGTSQESTTVPVVVPSCSAKSGALILKAHLTRATGISPLLTFFDATGSADSSLIAHTTAFQDVTYSWNFGDTGASGSGTWRYGANAPRNSMNAATGGVAAHLYITNGSDTRYTAKVTATDGTNTASCQLVLSVSDPNGSGGFPGSATTCVYSDGSLGNGCPAGARTLSTSSIGTALGSSYRVTASAYCSNAAINSAEAPH